MFQRVACALVTVLASGLTLQAGALIQRLPEDGAWVKFHAAETWENGTRRANEVVLKSVGKHVVDDVPCRWVELEFVSNEDGKPKSHAWKFLLPERELTRKGDPLSHIKEAWKQNDGEQPQKLTREYVRAVRPRLDNWLSPAIAGLRQTDERRHVKWQQGELDCEVHASAQRLTYPHLVVDIEYRLSLSDKVPFGVAAAEMNVIDNATGAAEEQEKGTIAFSMIDMGRNAVSKVQQGP